MVAGYCVLLHGGVGHVHTRPDPVPSLLPSHSVPSVHSTRLGNPSFNLALGLWRSWRQ